MHTQYPTPSREARKAPITGHGAPVTGDRRKPWYREPWPWALIAGPAAVVLAGAFTIWLAVSSNDGLVADDYYRQGLAINQMLARDREAARLEIRASVSLAATGALEVTLESEALPPSMLSLRLVHPTRSGEDQFLSLSLAAPGLYRAPRVPLPRGRRNIVLEDELGTWRLRGVWTLPADGPLALTPHTD